jgi:hypothetical protein
MDDLQRQRRLVQEHLAWLDAEIAREAGGLQAVQPPPTATKTPLIKAADAATAPSGTGTIAEADAETILAQYKSQPADVQSDVKRGCYIVFFAGIALFFALVAFAYWYYPSGRESAPPTGSVPERQ